VGGFDWLGLGKGLRIVLDIAKTVGGYIQVFPDSTWDQYLIQTH